MSSPRPNLLPMRSRRLPSALYFSADAAASALLAGCRRIPHASLESVDEARLAGPNVFVVGEERLLAANLKLLRAPELRVIMVSDERCADVRLDSAVYAYLPRRCPSAMLERMFDNAIDHIHLVQTRREANDKLALANSEIYELNHIGAALSAENNTHDLLELILTKCREITRADAGSLYLVEEEAEVEDGDRGTRAPKFLRFTIAQNDTVKVPFREVVLPIGERSIAGYVAKHGSAVMIEDAYEVESWVPYAINKQFDVDSGYRTRSILAVPMTNPKNEIVGVVQLINAKRNWRARLNTSLAVENEVVPFSTRQMEIVSSLASQAAVAYENSHLYENIHRLFEGFVKASIKAIEQRDPTTSGHSERVANLTVSLAEAVDRDPGYFKDVKFTRSEMKEIRYASLLHDFGKVAVREQVLTKARKLYPAQMDAVLGRFDFARRTAQMEMAERKLSCLEEQGTEAYLAAMPRLQDELTAQLKKLDGYFEVILRYNEPTVLPEGSFEKLAEIASFRFTGLDGREHALLTEEELRVLSIRKGSLDQDERREVESHVEHTYNFLRKIPWTHDIRNIPEIARFHHEKINGKGYPAHLSGEDIPLAARLMSIADVFDALAASDRPYKDSVSVEGALAILQRMSDAGEIDAHAFRLFVQAKVYEQWKKECFSY